MAHTEMHGLWLRGHFFCSVAPSYPDTKGSLIITPRVRTTKPHRSPLDISTSISPNDRFA